LGISRSGYYYEPKPPSEREVFLTQKIDEIYTDLPYYGSPKITDELREMAFW
jgi:putative transposase